MKNLSLILLSIFIFGCAESKNTEHLEVNSTNQSLKKNAESGKIEENLALLDNKKNFEEKSQSIQNIKKSLDYLVENTSSSREEIETITNKIVLELQKGKLKANREEFLWTCKSTMVMNNLPQKLKSKPDFADLATYVASDIQNGH